MLNKGQLTSYISNILLVLITLITTGTITQDNLTTLSAGLTSMLIAYLDLKHPRENEEQDHNE